MEITNSDLYQEPQGEGKAQLIKRLDRLHMRRNALRRDLERIDDEIDEAEGDLNGMDRWR
jgi:hypothetical protein